MLATNTEGRKRLATASDDDQHYQIFPFTALPQPLLELILIPSTSTKDKKALRQTCRLFQLTVDGSLSCVSLGCSEAQIEGRQCMESFFNFKAHQLLGLRTVAIVALNTVDSLLRVLPDHITTLIVHGVCIYARELTRLTCLTALCANPDEVGITYITGLTRLQSHSRLGSVAHLAPTLKQLSIWDYEHVQGIDQLTNLEVFQAWDNIPSNFFQTHRHSPITHMFIPGEAAGPLFGNSTATATAPAMLQRLTITKWLDTLPVLPTSVTHLQLMNAELQHIEQAGMYLPWLRHLDVGIDISLDKQWNHALSHLSKLTTLQCLGVYPKPRGQPLHTHDSVLSLLPELAQVVARGVRLDVIHEADQFIGIFQKPYNMQTAWGPPA